MLSPYELSLLYGVCRHDYRGHGEIVDGGPLLGAGTYAMARGRAHDMPAYPIRRNEYIRLIFGWQRKWVTTSVTTREPRGL